MARPKKGTKEGEQANKKWRETMFKRYGGKRGVHLMMQRIGSKGGQNGYGPDYKGGFASNKELARIAGAKGGSISRRTGKSTGDTKEKSYIWEGGRDGALVFKKTQ